MTGQRLQEALGHVQGGLLRLDLSTQDCRLDQLLSRGPTQGTDQLGRQPGRGAPRRERGQETDPDPHNPASDRRRRRLGLGVVLAGCEPVQVGLVLVLLRLSGVHAVVVLREVRLALHAVVTDAVHHGATQRVALALSLLLLLLRAPGVAQALQVFGDRQVPEALAGQCHQGRVLQGHPEPLPQLGHLVHRVVTLAVEQRQHPRAQVGHEVLKGVELGLGRDAQGPLAEFGQVGPLQQQHVVGHVAQGLVHVVIFDVQALPGGDQAVLPGEGRQAVQGALELDPVKGRHVRHRVVGVRAGGRVHVVVEGPSSILPGDDGAVGGVHVVRAAHGLLQAAQEVVIAALHLLAVRGAETQQRVQASGVLDPLLHPREGLADPQPRQVGR